MKQQLGKIIFGLTLLLVGAIGGAGIMLGMPGAQAQFSDLGANAGPDQTVYLPAPVKVQFDGSQSFVGSDNGPIKSYKWYNQWGTYQATGQAPAFDVHFGLLDGKQPKPGMTRSFKLVVTDSTGAKAQDWVKITLAEAVEDGSLNYDPAEGTTFTGSIVSYGGAREIEDQDLHQTVTAGVIKSKNGNERWYIESIGNSQNFPIVECHQGTHWFVFEEDDDPIPTHGREGCVGDSMIFHQLEISRRSPLPEETPQQWVIEADDGPLATLTREKGQQFGGGGVTIVFSQPR